jgi:hypothetical protein
MNGIVLSAMTLTGVAYNSPGFQVDASGNLIAKTITATGIITAMASATSAASMNIPQGTAPTTPNNGDIWFDGTNFKCRVGGVSKTFTIT